MPTQITSAGITFNDTTSLTSATLVANSVGTTQITNGSVTAAKLGTDEQKQICKAWVNFDGTGTIGQAQTIRSSYNISSVTLNSGNSYTIAFSTPMIDSNYVVVGMSNGTSADGTNMYWTQLFDNSSRTTSSFRIINQGSNLSTTVLAQCVVVFGN